MTLSRRNFVKLSVSASVLAAACNSTETTRPTLYQHGIASGDPTATSIVIWTHINTTKNTQVSWQLALDPNFNNIVRDHVATASSKRDYTVKVNVTGLHAGTTYYYRFIANKQISPVGQTRTLPTGNVAGLGLAIVSCSNFPFGYFNAYDAIAKDEDIDYVVHLGDYLYEIDAHGWGSNQGLGRNHYPENELLTLADYRLRHAQYKTDAGSKAMHARHPLIVTWDDHESANDPYMHGAQAHQSQTEGPWLSRRAAGLQAYYEWMPVRDPLHNHAPEELWRHYSFGNLASIITLETRHTGRSKQISYSEHWSELANTQSRNHFLNKTVGAAERTMLSPKMEDFLATALDQSKSAQQTWRIIGNQTTMARVNIPDFAPTDLDLSWLENDAYLTRRYTAMASLGRFNLPYNLDAWDGYPAAREAFYTICQNQGVNDLLVLTGDTHSAWFNQLSSNTQAMGYEIATTSVTSPGGDKPLGPNSIAEFDSMMVKHNPDILWKNALHRGYAKLVLTPQKAVVEYIGLDTVRNTHYTPSISKRVDIIKTKDSLRANI